MTSSESHSLCLRKHTLGSALRLESEKRWGGGTPKQYPRSFSHCVTCLWLSKHPRKLSLTARGGEMRPSTTGEICTTEVTHASNPQGPRSPISCFRAFNQLQHPQPVPEILRETTPLKTKKCVRIVSKALLPGVGYYSPFFGGLLKNGPISSLSTSC